MNIYISYNEESHYRLYNPDGTYQEVALECENYPALQAFMKNCCEDTKGGTSSICVIDAHDNAEVVLHCPLYEGPLLPNNSTVFYADPNQEESPAASGITILSPAVKLEIDEIASLI
jgi:hypothetical protein